MHVDGKEYLIPCCPVYTHIFRPSGFEANFTLRDTFDGIPPSYNYSQEWDTLG